MKLKLLLPAILLSIGVAGYADELVKVAILDIVDREGVVPYGQKLMLRSCLTTSVSLAPGYEGYDRVDMESIFGEQDFQRTGLVSSEQIHRLGEMTGASFVLVAEAAPFDAGNLVVSAKILDVETARITNSSENICPLNPPSEMRRECIEMAKFLLGISDTATPAGGNAWKKNSFNVINVDFANVDSEGNIITGYGSTLYSHTLKYIMPKIKYSGSREGSILLRYKIIKPDGSLESGSSSPSGYTAEYVCIVSKGSDKEVKISAWGNAAGGSYEPGTYRYELWLDEEKIYTTYFQVYSPGSNIIAVDKVLFANSDVDGNIINYFGSQLYSHSLKYLKPKVKYTGLDKGSVTLQVKIIKPNGTLESGSSSPNGYSYECVCAVFKGSDKEMLLSGWGADVGGSYKPGRYRYEIWLYGNKIYTTYFQVYSPESDIIKVDKVLFANSDDGNNIIQDFGSQLYSHSLKYLKPKVKYTGLDNGGVTLQIKIIKPDGSLSRGGSSPIGYTYETVCTVSKGNDKEMTAGGWGTKQGGTYKPGRYRYEIWLGGNKIYTTHFNVK